MKNFVYQKRSKKLWQKRANQYEGEELQNTLPTVEEKLPLRGPKKSNRSMQPLTQIIGDKKLSGAFQEELLTLLVNDTEALPIIIAKVDPCLLENVYYRTIAERSIGYYRKYHQAPGDHLWTLLEDKLNSKRRSDVRMYGDALRCLHEAQEKVNRQYVLDRLDSFVKQQTLRKSITVAAEELGRGDLEGSIDQLTKGLERARAGTTGGLLAALNAATHSYDEFRSMEFPPVTLAMDPPIQFPGIVQINGPRNHGKTLVLLYILVALASGKDDLWGWKCKRAYKVALLDGELPQQMVQDLLKAVCADLGVRWRAVRKNLHVISKFEVEDLLAKSENGRQCLNIADPKQTDVLVEFFSQFDIVGLDSVKTLESGADLNDGKDWEVIDDLCMRCRYKATTIIRCQHMGKDIRAGSRGASDQEDHLDVVIQVNRTTDDNYLGNPRAKVSFPKKGRNQDPKAFVPFELELATNEFGRREVRRIGAGEEKGKEKKPNKTKQMVPAIKALINQGEWGGTDDITQEEFGKSYEANKSQVNKAAKKAKEEIAKEQSLIHE